GIVTNCWSRKTAFAGTVKCTDPLPPNKSVVSFLRTQRDSTSFPPWPTSPSSDTVQCTGDVPSEFQSSKPALNTWLNCSVGNAAISHPPKVASRVNNDIIEG